MIERMILFGASGDLTSRLLLPAVAELTEAGLVGAGPEHSRNLPARQPSSKLNRGSCVSDSS